MNGLHPKITATVVAGALASLLVGELNRHGIQLAPEESSSVTVLLSFIAGFFVPSDAADVSAPPLPPIVSAAPAGAPPRQPPSAVPPVPPPRPVAPPLPVAPAVPPLVTATGQPV